MGMGNYGPLESKKRPTVSDTLKAAEEDHFLDCPDAELRIRLAALVLDFLMASLAISGLQNLCLAFQTHMAHLELPTSDAHLTTWDSLRIFLVFNAPAISAFCFIALRLAFIYFYFIWPLVFSGGSPGKLILGLRVVEGRTGHFPSLPNSLLRETVKVCGLIFGGIGILYLIFTKNHRVLHDQICETRVKRIHGRL